MKKRQVLLIDLDPQAHATLSLGISPDPQMPNIYNLLNKKADFAEVVQQTRIPRLSIIPSCRDLSMVEMDALKFSGDEMYLTELLHAQAPGFDMVIIDPPPSVGPLSVTALVAAQDVYIPMPMHFLALEGLAEMTRLIYQINAAWNPKLTLAGIIPTFFNKNTCITREISEDIIRTFGPDKLTPPIRQNISLAEAPGHGMTIFEYGSRSNGAADYDALAQFIDPVIPDRSLGEGKKEAENE